MPAHGHVARELGEIPCVGVDGVARRRRRRPRDRGWRAGGRLRPKGVVDTGVADAGEGLPRRADVARHVWNRRRPRAASARRRASVSAADSPSARRPARASATLACRIAPPVRMPAPVAFTTVRPGTRPASVTIQSRKAQRCGDVRTRRPCTSASKRIGPRRDALRPARLERVAPRAGPPPFLFERRAPRIRPSVGEGQVRGGEDDWIAPHLQGQIEGRRQHRAPGPQQVAVEADAPQPGPRVVIGHAEDVRAAGEVAERLGIETALGHEPGARARRQVDEMTGVDIARVERDNEIRRKARGKQGSERGVDGNEHDAVAMGGDGRQVRVERRAGGHEQGRPSGQDVHQRRRVALGGDRRQIPQRVEQVGPGILAPGLLVGTRAEPRLHDQPAHTHGFVAPRPQHRRIADDDRLITIGLERPDDVVESLVIGTEQDRQVRRRR